MEDKFVLPITAVLVTVLIFSLLAGMCEMAIESLEFIFERINYKLDKMEMNLKCISLLNSPPSRNLLCPRTVACLLVNPCRGQERANVETVFGLIGKFLLSIQKPFKTLCEPDASSFKVIFQSPAKNKY